MFPASITYVKQLLIAVTNAGPKITKLLSFFDKKSGNWTSKTSSSGKQLSFIVSKNSKQFAAALALVVDGIR